MRSCNISCVCLSVFSHSTTPSMSIYVVGNGRVSFFHGWVIFHCMYVTSHTFFIQASIDGHLDCFHIFATVNNTGGQIPLWDADQSHSEASPHPWQSVYYQKRQQLKSGGADVEIREPSCTVGGNVDWCSPCAEQFGGPSKTEKELIYDSQSHCWVHTNMKNIAN